MCINLYICGLLRKYLYVLRNLKLQKCFIYVMSMALHIFLSTIIKIHVAHSQFFCDTDSWSWRAHLTWVAFSCTNNFVKLFKIWLSDNLEKIFVSKWCCTEDCVTAAIPTVYTSLVKCRGTYTLRIQSPGNKFVLKFLVSTYFPAIKSENFSDNFQLSTLILVPDKWVIGWLY